MHCLGNAERLQLDNHLSFMLHEPVSLAGSLGYQSHFASYPYSFASYSYRCKILQPHIAATVRLHSKVVLFSTGALLMKAVIKKIIINNKLSTFASAGSFAGYMWISLNMLQLCEPFKFLFIFRFLIRFTQHAQMNMAFTVKIMTNF